MGEEEPAQTQDCASAYPGKPFCVDDACTSNPDSSGDCTTGITCTSEGYFPGISQQSTSVAYIVQIALRKNITQQSNRYRSQGLHSLLSML